MPLYYDQHLHTHFSYDSQANFIDYLENSTGYVVTTEHFDVANPVTGQTDAPDYGQYASEIAQLNRDYGNRVLKGIEIGYYQPKEAEIVSYLADKAYDLKLLSVHHNGEFDYLDDYVADMDFDLVFFIADLLNFDVLPRSMGVFSFPFESTFVNMTPHTVAMVEDIKVGSMIDDGLVLFQEARSAITVAGISWIEVALMMTSKSILAVALSPFCIFSIAFMPAGVLAPPIPLVAHAAIS